MNPALMILLLFDGDDGIPAGPLPAGPFRSEAGQAYSPGSEAGQAYTAGSEGGQAE